MSLLRVIASFWKELFLGRERLLESVLAEGRATLASANLPSESRQLQRLILAKRATTLWMVLWSSVLPAILSLGILAAAIMPALQRSAASSLPLTVTIAAAATFGVFYLLALFGLALQGFLLRPFASVLNRFLLRSR